MDEEIKNTASIDPGTQNKEQDDLLKKVYQRFNRAKDAQCRKDFLTDCQTAKRNFKGHPFTEEQEKEMKDAGIPPVKVARGTTNALKLSSILTAKRPELKAVPIGKGDIGVATLCQRAFRKIWDENTGNMKNNTLVLGAVREGEHHFNVKSEHYGLRDDVKILLSVLEGGEIVFDPDMSPGNPESWGYKIKYRAISPEQAKDLYKLGPDDLYYIAEAQPDKDSGSDHDSEPGGKYEDGSKGKEETKRTVWELEYYEKRKYQEKYWLDPGDSEQMPQLYPRSDDGAELENAKKNLKIKYTIQDVDGSTKIDPRYEEHVNSIKAITVTKTDLRYVLICGKKFIDDKINPYQEDSRKDPIDPIITLKNINIGEVYARGNMFFASGPLQEISKRRGQSIACVAATLGSPIMVNDNDVTLLSNETWKKDISKPKAILHYKSQDGTNKPEALYQTIPDLSRVFQLEDRAQNDLNDVFNLAADVMRGEQGKGRMSGRLAGMLKEFGMEGNSYLLAALEEVFRKLGVCFLAIALNEWPFRYWESLLEKEDYNEKGELKPAYQEALKKIASKNITIMDLDVGIRSGSSLPSSRAERLDMAIELATTAVPPTAIYDAEAVLEYIDDPQAADVLERRNQRAQMAQQIDQMDKQMKQMSMQLDSITKEKDGLKSKLDEKTLQKVASDGQQKFRYETTIEKMNLRTESMAETIGALMTMLKGFIKPEKPVKTTAKEPPGRAKGGPVKAGKPYVVGEEGEEVFVPEQDGVIIPNEQLAEGEEVPWYEKPAPVFPELIKRTPPPRAYSDKESAPKPPKVVPKKLSDYPKEILDKYRKQLEAVSPSQRLQMLETLIEIDKET